MALVGANCQRRWDANDQTDVSKMTKSKNAERTRQERHLGQTTANVSARLSGLMRSFEIGELVTVLAGVALAALAALAFTAPDWMRAFFAVRETLIKSRNSMA